ncbi:TetR/AcrR family transcriptional regulator [Mameliella sp.]|uniref:TetR/AcrR family transcriptional regulator n=1 Tax=Mameliella sp. TaxID=1924940 RepID=UPI003B511CEF
MTDRRQQILNASLPIFLAKGYSGTTISDIRKASGATTGSIYHFFDGKPGIAIALWRDATRAWVQKTEALGHSLTPEQQVKFSVRGLLEWATRNRALFLFFEELRIRAYSDTELAPITADVDQMHAKASEMYHGWIEQGDVIDIPWAVASALMMGPSYDYLRKHQENEDIDHAVELLVTNAWDSVRRTA